ncbi:MAG: phytoene desaturase [Flavobacteriales bacterium]|nr:phytoene desaturase [Flavobacteriales bacterium]
MKAAVIGSGIAGLASALRLAKAGFEVDVFERNEKPGGKLVAFTDKGYRFDNGPSVFTLPELVKELYDLAGESFEKDFRYRELDKSVHYFFSDGTFLRFYQDKEKLAKEIEEKLGTSADGYFDFLKSAALKYEKTAPLFLERSLHKTSTYLTKDCWDAVKFIHKLDLFQSLNESAAKTMSHPKLRQIANRFATYNGSNPFETPGIMSMIAHVEQNKGLYIPESGMHQISSSIYELAKRAGVRFHFNTAVTEITLDGKRANGIIAGGERYSFDYVVSNMDIVPTLKNLIKTIPAQQKVLKQERSSSALIYYWGVKKSFPNLDVHNIFFTDDYPKEFEHIFKTKDISSDPTVYVHISSKMVPGDAPEGCENWFTMINVPHRDGQDWDKLRNDARKFILDKLSRMLGEDIESLIEVESYWDPIKIEEITQSYRGSIHGTSSNSRMASFFRHPNFHQKIKGLFFAGGSVHPGAGIPLCLHSAKIATGMIEKDAEKARAAESV